MGGLGLQYLKKKNKNHAGAPWTDDPLQSSWGKEKLPIALPTNESTVGKKMSGRNKSIC